ncbi:MAG: hypothetical protein J7605_06670 [Variovorax sp.]|nr:hypothetical protein [Variovorax sp.]
MSPLIRKIAWDHGHRSVLTIGQPRGERTFNSQRYAMTKLLAAMIAGLLAVGAYAQNLAGASSEQQPVTNSKAQNRAQAKVEARPQGNVKKPTGDEAKNAEINPEASGGRAANAGQAKVDAKPQGMVKTPTGDEAKNAEINPEASGGKAANAGQAKVEVRDAKAAAKKKQLTMN